MGIGWRTVEWNMKECVCFCDWQVNGTVSLPIGLLSFIFPLLFDLTCYLLFPFFAVIHTFALLQMPPQIFERISADVTEKDVCALWELSSSHHTRWPCAGLQLRFRGFRWCGSKSRTWTWWHLDAAKHQQIHAYTYFNGCKKHSCITFHKYNCRSEISEKNMMFYSGLIVRSPKSKEN